MRHCFSGPAHITFAVTTVGAGADDTNSDSCCCCWPDWSPSLRICWAVQLHCQYHHRVALQLLMLPSFLARVLRLLQSLTSGIMQTMTRRRRRRRRRRKTMTTRTTTMLTASNASASSNTVATPPPPPPLPPPRVLDDADNGNEEDNSYK